MLRMHSRHILDTNIFIVEDSRSVKPNLACHAASGMITRWMSKDQ